MEYKSYCTSVSHPPSDPRGSCGIWDSLENGPKRPGAKYKAFMLCSRQRKQNIKSESLSTSLIFVCIVYIRH